MKRNKIETKEIIGKSNKTKSCGAFFFLKYKQC